MASRVEPANEMHMCDECLQYWWLTWSDCGPFGWLPRDVRVSRRKAIRLMRGWGQ